MTGRGRSFRGVLGPVSPTLLLIVCLLATSLLAGHGHSAATSGDDAAERAAREISAARERANDLADQLWTAQSEYDVLLEDAARLADEVERLEAEVARLRSNVESVAVARFVASGSAGIPVLTDVREPNDRVRADVFVDIVADVGAAALDDFAAVRTELDAARAQLEANRLESEAQQERLERLRVDAEAEVVRLREVEQQRLQDEAVRQALEAQRREEERAREEAARRDAAAARQAELDAAADEQVPDRPTPAAGSADGGQLGSGGGGSRPAAAFVDGIACPVVGGSAWGDTWGAPRSGGRRHQGVDMLAPIGTPLAAVTSGVTEHRSNRLGGITITLMGDNGHRYYYAHLDGYEGPAGRVSRGQVIGYIGDTGNATGVPHLHFEIRPGGGVPVNPTPSVRAAGC